MFQNSLGELGEEKEVEFLGYLQDDKLIGAALIIFEHIRGKYYYAYCPRGPVMSPDLTVEQQKKFICSLINHIEKEHEPVFFRIEPEREKHPTSVCQKYFNSAAAALSHGATPRCTRVLDLRKSAEDLLKEMKPKTRYNIRLAERKGVQVTQGYDQSFQDNFIKLLAETTKRDKFIAFAPEYYRQQLEFFGPKGNLQIFQATVDGEPAAAIMVSFYGPRAIYLHGASSHKYRAAMPNFAVQWAAIKAAQEKQMQTYDFWGVAPQNAGSKHPWAGITRFKEGFGGEYKEWVGPHDHIIKPLLYKAYAGYKKLRRY